MARNTDEVLKIYKKLEGEISKVNSKAEALKIDDWIRRKTFPDPYLVISSVWLIHGHNCGMRMMYDNSAVYSFEAWCVGPVKRATILTEDPTMEMLISVTMLVGLII